MDVNNARNSTINNGLPRPLPNHTHLPKTPAEDSTLSMLSLLVFEAIQEIMSLV